MRTARWLRPWLTLALGATLLGCATPATPSSPPSPTKAESPAPEARVILVAIDGVRWQEVFRGVDPELGRKAGMIGTEVMGPRQLLPVIYRRFFDEGAMLGAPGSGGEVWASGPNFMSLPGYREMLSGDPGGCLNNGCGPIERPTLADRVRESLARRDEDVALISSWETIERAAAVHPERVVVSTGRHGGVTRDKVRLDTEASRWLDDGALSSALPGDHDYRPDRYTAGLALRYLALAHPRFLFVGLGDTDEHAHARDYRAYVRSMQEADRFLGALFDQLDAMGEDGAHTTVIVTTDHGRADQFADHGARWPESGRVFVMLGGRPVRARGAIDAGPGARLGGIVPTVLSILGLPR